MRVQRLENLRDHPRIRFASRWLFIRISDAQAAAKIEVTQQNSVTAQIAKVRSQSLQRFTKRIKRHNLRSDMHANSLPTIQCESACAKYSRRASSQVIPNLC